ncbi:MAG TPA: type II secretion system F family protein [Gemmatimonadaceae bacterium]
MTAVPAQSGRQVDRAAAASWTPDTPGRPRHLSTRDTALGLRVLATLLSSGLPLRRAIHALPDLAPAAWRPALPGIEAAVRQGSSFGSALERSALRLPPVVVGVIRAGEAGSGLAPAVARAASFMEDAVATRAAVRSALAYPAVLAVAGLASVVVLVGVVLPRFAGMLKDLGESLPASTRFVLEVATVLRTGAFPMTALLIVTLMVWRAWVRTNEGAVRWHGWLLSLPVLGPLRYSAATARACQAAAALLESGVPLPSALLHAARASGDAALASQMLASRQDVIVGMRPSQAIAKHGAMTDMAARLIRAGEESGQLAVMLAHAAQLEGERARGRVRAAVTLLEPALILVFSGIVGVVAAALLQAIYSVRPS